MSAPKILLDRKQAAYALSISPRSLDYLLADGRIPCVRVGGRVQVSVKALEEFARGDQSAYIVPKAA